MMSRLLCLLALLCVCHSQVLVKNLAGPPSDFAEYSLPNPQDTADVQNSAILALNLQPSEESHVLAQTVTLPVDSDLQFGFTFYSPNDNSIKLSLQDPEGRSVKLHGSATFFPIGDMEIPGTSYVFKNPKIGDYVLTIKTRTLDQDLYDSLSSNIGPDAYVVLWNEDPLSSHTYLNTYSLLTGHQVGLVTRVFNNSLSTVDMPRGTVPKALQGSVQDAEMSVVFPDGSILTTTMSDDGLHADEGPDDGAYGALITATEPGQYVFTATVRGITAEGRQYMRSTQQLVTVIEPTMALLGTAVAAIDDSQTRMNIFVAVNALIGSKYKAYAEVWGKDESGEDIAIAWIGGMAFAEVQRGINSLSLELDLSWISRVKAQEPLTLRNVIIQDPQTFVPISQADNIPVKTTFSLALQMSNVRGLLIGQNGVITAEMLEGRRPEQFNANINASADATIVLVHGYCSDQNPFSKYASDWTNAKFFLNANKNLLHDDFAVQVLKWSGSFGAFSYAGHSQGGCVGLHLKNFYWSGLDLVDGGRILQSVGTPYQGSSSAGTAADLAKLFGVACGANQDLSKDGSSLWLKGITAQNRALVHYYTTTYVQGKVLGDYCNLATNVVLKWPNDGVAEQELSQLPSGQNQGNTEGWCHTANMKYAPQCEYQNRNKIMNAAAARKIKN